MNISELKRRNRPSGRDIRFGRVGKSLVAPLVALVVAAFPFAARAADAPGSKDPPGFQRFDGSDIIHYVVRSYDEYAIAHAENSTGHLTKIEGGVTRIMYRIPEGHTPLEVFRNYEQMLTAAGLKLTYELGNGSTLEDDGFYTEFFNQTGNQGVANPFVYEGSSYQVDTDRHYATFSGTLNGQDLNVAILAVTSHGISWQEPGVKDPYEVKPGQTLAALDVISRKTAAQQMVTVKATDLAKAIATTGFVDIYGVLFDVDKADIKPESSPTLAQVAELLKTNPKLRLEISGHTDNTGNAGHNMMLSQQRATAVVHSLVQNYAIDARRLSAKGYGATRPVARNDTDAGRAKNRRVELRRI